MSKAQRDPHWKSALEWPSVIFNSNMSVTNKAIIVGSAFLGGMYLPLEGQGLRMVGGYLLGAGVYYLMLNQKFTNGGDASQVVY